jgi:hypothetical protein
MSGCAAQETTSTQLNTIGKVQITSIICAGTPTPTILP